MIDEMPAQKWFATKSVGDGVHPVTWRGWAVVVAAATLFALAVLLVL